MQVKEYKSIATFVLLQSNIKELNEFNKGFNGEVDKGLFHIMYTNIYKDLIFRKPTEALHPNKQLEFLGIEVKHYTYMNDIKTLLVFELNNN